MTDTSLHRPRLDDDAVATLKATAADCRATAKVCDELARKARSNGDTSGARMWTLDARRHRRNAKDCDEAVSMERFWRRVQKSNERWLARMEGRV